MPKETRFLFDANDVRRVWLSCPQCSVDFSVPLDSGTEMIAKRQFLQSYLAWAQRRRIYQQSAEFTGLFEERLACSRPDRDTERRMKLLDK